MYHRAISLSKKLEAVEKEAERAAGTLLVFFFYSSLIGQWVSAMYDRLLAARVLTERLRIFLNFRSNLSFFSNKKKELAYLRVRETPHISILNRDLSSDSLLLQ